MSTVYRYLRNTDGQVLGLDVLEGEITLPTITFSAAVEFAPTDLFQIDGVEYDHESAPVVGEAGVTVTLAAHVEPHVAQLPPPE